MPHASLRRTEQRVELQARKSPAPQKPMPTQPNWDCILNHTHLALTVRSITSYYS